MHESCQGARQTAFFAAELFLCGTAGQAGLAITIITTTTRLTKFARSAIVRLPLYHLL